MMEEKKKKRVSKKQGNKGGVGRARLQAGQGAFGMNFTSPGLWSFCVIFAWISSSPYAGIGLSGPLQSWGTQEERPIGQNLVTESGLTEDQEKGRDGDLQGYQKGSILLGLQGETWVGLERWEPEGTHTPVPLFPDPERP